MKKLLITNFFALIVVIAMAVPVQRGHWRTITLADGSKHRVEAVGDEFCSYWRSSTGEAFINKNNTYVKADVHELEETVSAQREEENIARNARFQKYFGRTFGSASNGVMRLPALKKLEGVKKGIVLLVEFADIHFTAEHTPEFYTQVLNVGGPEEMGYKGSVKQYFLDQSNDKFTVDFDVSPIVRLPKNHGEYVAPSYFSGARDIIRYTVDQLKTNVAYGWTSHDWSDYDWDNDGQIDMVFLLYAGYGQATKEDDKTLIWPHQSSLGSNKPVVSGKIVDTYACSNELNWNGGEGDIDMGIGTFCHEFSHCLGYPDLYDVCYDCIEKGKVTAMDWWDLMDNGCYCSNGFVPCPYTCYEKLTAGWITIPDLEDNTEYKNLRPITEKDGGDVYIMKNPNNPNEFYIFEAIQNTGWATGFYRAKGLRIIHIDYKQSAWISNLVNCVKSPSINNIARYTYIPADGSYDAYSTAAEIRGDLFPYKEVNSVELKWNTGDSQGNKDCQIKVHNIVINTDNTVSFVTGEPTAIESVTVNGDGSSTTQQSYTIFGQKADSNYRGIVIKGGKKYMIK